MEPISWATIAQSVIGGVATSALSSALSSKGGEQQQAPAAPEQAPQSQSAKSASAATMMQKNADMEGPMAAGSTLLTSKGLGAGMVSNALGAKDKLGG